MDYSYYISSITLIRVLVVFVVCVFIIIGFVIIYFRFCLILRSYKSFFFSIFGFLSLFRFKLSRIKIVRVILYVCLVVDVVEFIF